MSNKQHIEGYLEQVCRQVRWRKAHPVIRSELSNHMEDQAEAFAAGGMDHDTAEMEAVKTMGAPELVGSQLDHSYRPRPAWGIIAVAMVIMAIGFFARMYLVENIELHYVQQFNWARSLLWQLAAVAAAVAVYFVDYTIFARLSSFAYLAFLGTVLFSGSFLGMRSYHLNHHLLLLMPVIYAAVLWRFPYKGYGGLLVMYLFTILMVLSNLTVTAMVYGAICVLLLTVRVLTGAFSVKKPLGLLLVYGPAAAFGGWLIANTSILDKLHIWLHPELDPLGMGYSGSEVHRILAGARLIGTGSATIEPYFLPDAVRSHMLTFLIHQFGWIVLIAVLLLFGALLAFSCVKISRLNSELGRMVAGAATATFALQCVLYVINNLNGILLSFASLPMLSYGNGALVANALLLGLLLSVFRNDDVVCEAKITPKRVPRVVIRIEPSPPAL